MNGDSEQITIDKNLVIGPDQPLCDKELKNVLLESLGRENCRILSVPPRRWVIEYSANGKIIHLLVKNCTYLGNPHPIYKKRVQLPTWFNEYVREKSAGEPAVDVRFIGVYHYGSSFYGDNIIFIDFKKDTYINKKGHNSSAHVYINDLFQAMTYGIFSKLDVRGNTITTVRRDKFATYLSGENLCGENLFELFRRFNQGFSFGVWLKAIDVIKEMHENSWGQWRQAEWPGWYLEYRFNKFTVDNKITQWMRYVGSSQKREGDLDFDIRFEDENFYGDLKASDIVKKETPGNDQNSLVECIYNHDRFWYIIYEHETIKDINSGTDFEATRDRNKYIRSVDPSYDKDDMSYHKRMKNSVKFVRMTIIELNRINYRGALIDFNQGRQPDGSARNPKFLIDKKKIVDDNFVVFKYSYERQDKI